MIIIFWTCVIDLFTHISFWYILGARHDHIPLKYRCPIKIQLRTNRSTLWAYSSSIDNHEQFTCFILDLKIGYDTTKTCAHVHKFHITYIARKLHCKAKWELYTNTHIFLKCLVIGPVCLTFQHNVNSSWHALIKPHAILFIKIGIH